MNWLLQWNTGVAKEVPQEVLLAIGERLFSSLRDKTSNAIARARKKLETVIYPDSAYGGNIDTWFDDENIQAEAWNIYVVLPLVAELKVDLKSLEERLQSLEAPSLDDLNEIWDRVEEIRDAIAALPSPNFFERIRLEFGGAKRSALIKVFRSAQSWLRTELARKVSERCLPIIGMAMAEPEGPLELQIPEESLVEYTPKEPEGAQESENSWIPGPGAQFSALNANGDGIWTELVRSVDGTIAPLFTYQVKGVIFTENDIHLDGIYHREDLSYVLALDLLEPSAKARVMDRLREEQYDEF
jgi:hypothetical protein